MNAETKLLGNFAGFTVGLVVLVLLTFGILQWLGVESGDFIDWIVGTASFWWLVVIVTVPWNVHFEAKTVLADAEISKQKGITVNDRNVHYAAKIARRALWVAFALHGSSALVLYLLAVFGISSIGYVSSLLALLLTGLRPAIATYLYLSARLTNIGHELKYPRNDIVKVQQQLLQLEDNYRSLAYELDPEQTNSWRANSQRILNQLGEEVANLSATYRQLKADNAAEHQRLAQEAKTAIAQLNADSEFLDRVREIIRFFKSV
ncbi:MAG: hypothetical protein F6K03_11200 [Kamptonema sp. SIO4C4]|nr:hypothetical protein [Kamptonema sp. SIO4C4]